jgi:probable F420-dependent oxidoreductase
MTGLEFGVTLPVFDSLLAGIPPVQQSARLAESLGFDSVWAGDHLFFHRPNHECLIALAAAAGATERIDLGSGVLLPALREPVALAKQIATMCHISGDRFILGVGVGGEYGAEWEAVGKDPAERGRHTDDFLEFLGDAFQGQPITFSGRCVDIHAPAMLPAPARMPPVWVGGRSQAALRRAATHADGWLSVWSSPRRIREAREELELLAAERDRPPPRIGLVCFLHVGRRDEALRHGSAFVQGHYAMPFGRMEKWFLAGEPIEVADQLLAYREAGVSLFMFYPAAQDPSAQFEAVREVAELVSKA